MKLQNFFLFALLFGSFLQPCFSQETEEMEENKNWIVDYKVYGSSYIYFNYERYSKEDIEKFKEKLEFLRTTEGKDEWEGSYFWDQGEVTNSRFRWNSKAGFVDFAVYTCLPELRRINYGKVVNLPDSIQIFPEYAENSPRKNEIINYIKVRWHKSQYLVEESSVQAFAEKAAGIYVDSEDTLEENLNKWSNYWVRHHENWELEEGLIGLPEFPGNYKKFARLPIETKIISVGRTIVEEKDENGSIYSENASYTIKIGAGKDKSVKIGMKFKISEIGEEIIITQVNKKTSVGEITRSIDDNKNDYCFIANSEETSCQKIKSSLKITTKPDYLSW